MQDDGDPYYLPHHELAARVTVRLPAEEKTWVDCVNDAIWGGIIIAVLALALSL